MSKETKDAYYFKHDINARNDIELSSLRMEFSEMAGGMEMTDLCKLANLAAHGFWFILIEILREQTDFKITDNSKVRKFIAKETNLSLKMVTQFIEMLCSEEYGLLTKEDGFLYSKRLIRDMEQMNETRGKFSKAGKASADARKKSEAEIKPDAPHVPLRVKTLVLTPRFYSMWKDYTKNMGGETDERKQELKFIEEHFKDKETIVINKLYASIVNQTEKVFFKDLNKES